ncbi:hypothetical protein [Streptomyces cyaneus]|uniref:hypothetical protein n=1 Tax=Streptomyces cyaneus TaxID=1904 RepID=UPI001C6584D7|nr:hypothetical protein [Streptomyces cyaneus]
MVHRFTGELAVGGGLKVVIEPDLPDVRLAHDHLVVAPQPSSSEEAVGHLSDGTDTEALRALALAAETGLVPLLWPEHATPPEVTGPFYHLVTGTEASSSLTEGPERLSRMAAQVMTM